MSRAQPRSATLVVVVVMVIQLLGWAAAGLISAHHPALLALCGLAYSLGLRHGLDADHIAAIDNVSRDLIGRGVRPVGLGLFFALGHSSVISLASVATAGAAMRFHYSFGRFREWATIYTTLVSVSLLLLVAPRNLMAAWRSYRELRGRPQCGDGHPAHSVLGQWLVRRISSLQVKTWHMFFIGALFGLGFETTSAMAVLAMTGAEAAGGAGWTCILIFPLLFTAGMTLVDTTDAIFVEHAYGWALRRPREHALYNLAVTGFSATVALFVGGLELTNLITAPATDGEHWSLIALLEAHFDALGAAVVLILAGIWLVAVFRSRSDPGGSTLPKELDSLDEAAVVRGQE